MEISLEQIDFDNKDILNKVLEWRNNIDTRNNSLNTNIIDIETFNLIIEKYKSSKYKPLIIFGTYPLTNQDVKKSLGLCYADSSENLKSSTCIASRTSRCHNIFSHFTDTIKLKYNDNISINIESFEIIPLGIITFINEHDIYYIGINIDPNYRMQNIASKALFILIHTCSNKYFINDKIIAKIKKTNNSSIKLFSKYFIYNNSDENFIYYYYDFSNKNQVISSSGNSESL